MKLQVYEVSGTRLCTKNPEFSKSGFVGLAGLVGLVGLVGLLDLVGLVGLLGFPRIKGSLNFSQKYSQFWILNYLKALKGKIKI